MKQGNFKLDKDLGTLECYVFSLKNSDIEESEKFKELGIDNKDNLFGEPIEIFIDIESLGGITFFNPNKCEIYSKDNFVPGTYVEFVAELNFVLLIEFKEFKEAYTDYLKYRVKLSTKIKKKIRKFFAKWFKDA